MKLQSIQLLVSSLTLVGIGGIFTTIVASPPPQVTQLPFDLMPGTEARASEVMANFNHVNDAAIMAQTTADEAKTAAGMALVPFVVEIPGGLANSAGRPSANPVIRIDGGSTFVVKSIMVRTNVPPTGFRFLSVNSVTIDGSTFDTTTSNLVGHLGTGIDESADLMGMPVRVTGLLAQTQTGGNFPHEIIADAFVTVQFFARSDVSNLDISLVRVSGWKDPNSFISVTYTPGN